MRTSIQLTPQQKRRLDRHKLHPRETYGDVIARALDVLDEDEYELSDNVRAEVEAARRDIKAGRGLTTAQVRKELGL